MELRFSRTFLDRINFFTPDGKIHYHLIEPAVLEVSNPPKDADLQDAVVEMLGRFFHIGTGREFLDLAEAWEFFQEQFEARAATKPRQTISVSCSGIGTVTPPKRT